MPKSNCTCPDNCQRHIVCSTHCCAGCLTCKYDYEDCPIATKKINNNFLCQKCIEKQKNKIGKYEYIERLTHWLMPDNDPELAEDVRKCMGLDGIYNGSSERIRKLLRIAYLRGVRRGAAIAWESSQPVLLRETEEK